MNQKCEKCGRAMKSSRENIRWDALPNAVIVNAELERCANCGEYGVAFPALDRLIDLAARAVVAKQGRLCGPEVRFLRSFLDLEGAELAEALGSNPSTLSRWEHDRQPIGRHADLFLRALVLLQLGDTTPGELLPADREGGIGPAALYAFEHKGDKWTVGELAAKPAAAPKKTKRAPRTPAARTTHRGDRAQRAAAPRVSSR